jgi:hypothetical protein
VSPVQDTPQAETSRILNLAKQQMQCQAEAAANAHGNRFGLPEPRLSCYAVQDFFCADPRELAIRCYQLVLERPPGPEELSNCLAQLVSGTTLTQLIAQLRQSPESQDHPVRISGLYLASLAERHRKNALISVIANKLDLLPPLPDTTGYHSSSFDSRTAGADSQA